jgi:hypothetical protein
MVNVSLIGKPFGIITLTQERIIIMIIIKQTLVDWFASSQFKLIILI